MCLLERIPTIYMNSHLQTPETFWLYNQVLGIQGTQNISPKLTIPRSSCIHPSTHNQETFGNRLPQPSKNIRYTSHGNTPELATVLGYRKPLTNNCTKEIFDVGVLNSGIPEPQRQNYDNNTSELNSPGHCHYP